MVSKLRAKSGEAWVGPIADGKIYVKSGGVWCSPVSCKIKSGGVWVDSGYQGIPGVPSMPWVVSWSYTATRTQFNGPASGPTVQDYHVERLDAAGTAVEGYYQTSGIRDWGTPKDTKHQFRVRSRAASGLHSAWVGNLKVGIGHPETYNYGYVQRTRYWSSPHGATAANKDQWIAYTGPASVLLQGMHWRNLRTPQSSVVRPGTNREVNWILISADYGSIGNNLGTVYSGNNTDWALNNWGDNAAWGIIPRGAGWSTTSNSTYMLHVDDFWIDGTEYYDNYEIVSTNPAQGNYYW